MRENPGVLGLSLALGLSCAWSAPLAHAQELPLCSELPNPIYLQVGDTQEPLMKGLGRALADSSVMPMTLVYLKSSSCTNIEAMYTGLKITANPNYVPSSAENPGFTSKDAAPFCNIGPDGHA